VHNAKVHVRECGRARVRVRGRVLFLRECVWESASQECMWERVRVLFLRVAGRVLCLRVRERACVSLL
jgi:hypothetical protein